MRWVFIRPCNISPYYDPEIQEPLGLEYLTASRQSKSDSALLLDVVFDGMSEISLARRAISYAPDAIGFSITTAQEIESVLAIHAECRRVLGERPVRWLAGGNYITTETANALKRLPDDFTLARFEGENLLNEFAAPDAADCAAAHVENDAGISRVFEGAFVDELDSLPFPARPYANAILGMEGPFNIQSSRGCCGNCRYCSSPGMMHSQTSRRRARSVENIAEELEELGRKYGARSFNFVDEDFLGLDKYANARALEFVEHLSNRNLDISFSIQVRPHTLDRRIIDMLCGAGLCYVFMGIESDSRRDCRRWGRALAENPWRHVDRFHKHGVGVGAGVLLFHSHSTFKGIRRFALKLNEHGLLNYRSAINRMDAMPGSFYYEKEMREGRFPPGAAGPLPLPYVHRGIDALHRDIAGSLDPLGPPSMHAVCSLPRMAGKFKQNPKHEKQYLELKRIVKYLDDAVARTFFAQLDHHEKGTAESAPVGRMRRKNLKIALEAVKDLVNAGFAPSFESLREAIRIDAGI